MSDATVHIDLREGFENDEVVIRLNETEVFRKAGVTTLPQVGRADAVEAPVEGGSVSIHVDLPRRGVSRSFTVAPGMHLGVSLVGQELTHEISSTPFRYA